MEVGIGVSVIGNCCTLENTCKARGEVSLVGCTTRLPRGDILGP